MVQLNNDERVWVCFEMARVQKNAHAVQRLGPKGGFPLIAEITSRQFLQQKFGAKTIAASIT